MLENKMLVMTVGTSARAHKIVCQETGGKTSLGHSMLNIFFPKAAKVVWGCLIGREAYIEHVTLRC
jgi:hypothetical protein